MSAWDAYITTMKDRGLELCGIFGLDGSQWASSSELKASAQEVQTLVSGIKAGSFPNGIHIGGVKYTLINTQPGVATMKCRSAPTDAQKYLVHVALGSTCVVMGGISGAGERSTCKHVEDIRDYLAQSGY